MNKNLTKEKRILRAIKSIAGKMAEIAERANPLDWGELFDLCETLETLEDGLKEAVEDLRFLEQEIDEEENYD